MSIQKVKEYLEPFGVSNRVQEFNVSSATVELAAQALGCEGARIAKSMSYKVGDKAIIVVAAGDVRTDNKKYKAEFKKKAKMLKFEEVEPLTGHPVGGVCPFALPEDVEVYLDKSLKRFKTVFPAVGTANSAIELTPDELFNISKAIRWVDIAKESQIA